MATKKLTLAHTKKGKFKEKTRDATKKWKEERTKAFWEARAKSKEKKCPACKKELPVTNPKFVLEGKDVCMDCGMDSINQQKATLEVQRIKDKKKEMNDYGYFLWRQEPC